MRPSFPAAGHWTFKLLGEEPSGWGAPKELSAELSPTLPHDAPCTHWTGGV